MFTTPVPGGSPHQRVLDFSQYGTSASSRIQGRILIKRLKEPSPIEYDPTFWMELTSLSVEETVETQFSIMQLAMDWYYSPIARQRQLLEPLLRLYHMRGSGCPDGTSKCPYAVTNADEVHLAANVGCEEKFDKFMGFSKSLYGQTYNSISRGEPPTSA